MDQIDLDRLLKALIFSFFPNNIALIYVVPILSPCLSGVGHGPGWGRGREFELRSNGNVT